MGDKTIRYEDNVPGQWYTDQKCILCCVCAEMAPRNFKQSLKKDHDVVYKQPTTESEVFECMEAMEACPVEAIGNDGVSSEEALDSDLDESIQGNLKQQGSL